MPKKHLKTLLLASFVLVFFGLAKSASADTHYVRKTGNGSACTQAAPCLTITAGIAAMSSGDTLIIGDGVYEDDRIRSMPSGSAGAYTVIKAENVGGAIVDMRGVTEEWADSGIDIGNGASYIQVEGFRIHGNDYYGGHTNGVVTVNGGSHHIKLIRVGANAARIDYWNQVGFTVRNSSDILLEECWTWGTGRYKFNIYKSSKVIVRRCVLRHDYHISNQEGLIVNYDSSNVVLQNNIMIDSGTTGTYPGEAIYGAIWDEKHYSEGDVDKSAKYTGNIILNIRNNHAAHLDRASGTRLFENNIIWDSGSGGYVVYPLSDTTEPTIYPPNVTISKNTIGALALPTGTNSDLGTVYNTGGLGVSRRQASGTFSVTNSIVYNAEVAGIDFPVTNSFMALYGNGTNYRNGASTGTGNITTINPLTNGLRYLPRIEDGSVLKTAGSGGGQIGAEVMYKYGVSGTLHGEAGYDTLTNEPLWPFPNEALIKSDMASYSGPGPAGARGFATGNSIDGNPQTLTKYIWEYLGNQIPCDVYGTCSGDVVAPSSSSGLSVM